MKVLHTLLVAALSVTACVLPSAVTAKPIADKEYKRIEPAQPQPATVPPLPNTFHIDVEMLRERILNHRLPQLFGCSVAFINLIFSLSEWLVYRIYRFARFYL